MQHHFVVAASLMTIAGLSTVVHAQQQPIVRATTTTPIIRKKISLPSNNALLASTTVDEFIENLPDWRNPKPDRTVAGPEQKSQEKVDGRNYNVTRQRYSITETPDEIITFEPVNGFWLGALVQERGLTLGLGSLQEIAVPATKRAPFKVTTSLAMPNNYRQVNSPSASMTSSAIGSLIDAASQRKQNPSMQTVSIVENYDESYAAHELGLDASYMGARVKAALSFKSSANRHTITAAFIERAFTVSADFEGRSRREAFFNNTFTVDDAKNLVKQGNIAYNNSPTYIKSITYGRVMLFNLTSSLSEEEMKAMVDASYNAGVGSVRATYKGNTKQKTTNFEVRVTTFGGPQTLTQVLIPAKGIEQVVQVMNNYLKQPAPLTTMVPISYSSYTVRDNLLAALSKTTEYTVTKYAGTPIGERYKITMWFDITGSDDGVADNTVELFGEVRVNGNIWWAIDKSRSNAYSREKGERLEISGDTQQNRRADFVFDYFYDQKTPFQLGAWITDYDSGSGNDPVGKFSQTIDLKSLAGKGNLGWTWKSGDGESCRLNIRVDVVEYL